MIIKSRYITLREVEKKDLPILMKWRNSSEVKDYIFGTNRYTMKGQLRWFKRLAKDKSNIYFVVEDKKGKSFGSARINNIDKKNRKCEIGGEIGDLDYRGKGLGKEVFRVITNYCFRKLKMNKVYLKVFTFNKKAIHIYRKLGFKTEGILKQEIYKKGKFKDVLQMRILKKEYFDDDQKLWEYCMDTLINYQEKISKKNF